MEVHDNRIHLPKKLLVDPVERECEQLHQIDDEPTDNKCEDKQKDCYLPLLEPIYY